MSCKGTYIISFKALVNLVHKLGTHVYAIKTNNLPNTICLLLLIDDFVLVHIPRS